MTDFYYLGMIAAIFWLHLIIMGAILFSFSVLMKVAPRAAKYIVWALAGLSFSYGVLGYSLIWAGSRGMI